QLVMDAVIQLGPISRAKLAEVLAISKPTISEIVREFEHAGWIHEAGRTSGNVGRTAIAYELRPRASHVVGIDLGGTKIRGAITGLDGVILAEELEPTDHAPGGTLDQVERLCRTLVDESESPWDTLIAVALGVPGVPDPQTGEIHLSPNLPHLEGVNLARELADRLGVEVSVRNDVNLAALGEGWQGAARGMDDFVCIAVGTGIGMGIVADGELRLGAAGAAGEIGFLPLGAEPLEPVTHPRGALEHFASGPGIARRFGAASGADVDTVEVPEVLAAAVEGEEPAVSLVDETNRALAEAVLAVVAVCNPQIVLLGGGVGSSRPIVAGVREWVERLTSRSITVDVPALGPRAALIGAIGLALRMAHESLFSAPRSPALALPDGRGGDSALVPTEEVDVDV
ncbi:MAG: ROK family transcriptional regulator, partial [Acidimicrobiia bacterium]